LGPAFRAVEAFTGGASGPVNIATSGVYQWWYTIGMRSNQDLSFFFLALEQRSFSLVGFTFNLNFNQV
jgi:photosystem I P700 chlorophyll a apoprotein A2